MRRTLIIGNKNYSSWSLRAWLLLAHLGDPFEEIRIPLDTPETKARIREHNPAGKVPVLLDGDLAVWDTLAIAEYLAERHPELWPEDPAARAVARSVCAEMHAGFPALRRELPMNCRAVQREISPSPAALSDIARIEALWADCRERFGDGGPWLFGRFGIPDAVFAPVAIRFHGYAVDLSPDTRAYVDTQLAGPHLAAWIAAGRAEAEVIAADEAGTPTEAEAP